MNILRKLRRWCPQPNKPILTNSTRLSSPVIAGVLFVEIVALLIAPMVYCALLLPKNIVVAPDQTLPLTNSQIKAAWPNLPTAQEIVNSANGTYGYSLIDSSMPTFNQVKNYTWISPENAIPHTYPAGVFVTKLVPVEFNIWLQLNDTTWVSPDSSYLAATTNNPPYSLPSSLYINEQGGFLGIGLPTVYVIIAVIAIMATLTAGFAYLRKKGSPLRSIGE